MAAIPRGFATTQAARTRTLPCVAVLVAVAALFLAPTPAHATAGKASYYTAPYTPSACYGNDPNQFPADGNFAAASASIYASGAACGQYYTISCTGSGCNGGGPISVKIVDLCPGCAGLGRDFDLSQEAFSHIADLDVGVISINY
ncbi:hypothetical protein L7F22_052353 [Adiantum nelumboides]|nr:hypothetical protein [Adiantum nelumboides]